MSDTIEGLSRNRRPHPQTRRQDGWRIGSWREI